MPLAQTTLNKTDPLKISKNIFNALSPLEQLAARALEQVGKVKIVEQEESARPG